MNNICDFFARFFYTLPIQVHKGTAGAHAQGQFRPSITRIGNGRHRLLSLLYKEREKERNKQKERKKKPCPAVQVLTEIRPNQCLQVVRLQ